MADTSKVHDATSRLLALWASGEMPAAMATLTIRRPATPPWTPLTLSRRSRRAVSFFGSMSIIFVLHHPKTHLALPVQAPSMRMVQPPVSAGLHWCREPVPKTGAGPR